MSDQQSPPTPSTPGQPTIRTVLDKDSGQAYVLFQVGDPTTPNSIRMQIQPQAGCELALNLLSACYAAIGEQAALEYALANKIAPAKLIDLMRYKTNRNHKGR